MKASLLFCVPLLVVSCQPKHSPDAPAGTESTEKQDAAVKPTPESFVGLELKAAQEKADKADLPHRVVREDGKDFPVTRDYRPERLNFTVEKGIVTKVSNG